jgi:hypothetical protein
MKRICAALSGLLLLALAGCGFGPPPFTEVEGIVTINDQPLPHAEVRFVPSLEGTGMELISVARTDEKGFYRLQCGQNPGACVCTHKITVTEAPTPAEFRRMDAQDGYTRYKESLKNRPIPATYATAALTPLEVAVTADRRKYNLKLVR